MSMHGLNLARSILVAISIGGCAGDDRRRLDVAQERFIPSVGGTLRADGVEAVFDPGDLPGQRAVDVRIARTSLPAPAGFTTYSPLSEFLPSMQFAQPVRVCLKAAEAPVEAGIFWSREQGSGFEPLRPTREGDRLCAEVTHFSYGFVGAHASTPSADAGGAAADAGPGGAGDARPFADASPVPPDAEDAEVGIVEDLGRSGMDGPASPDAALADAADSWPIDLRSRPDGRAMDPDVRAIDGQAPGHRTDASASDTRAADTMVPDARPPVTVIRTAGTVITTPGRYVLAKDLVGVEWNTVLTIETRVMSSSIVRGALWRDVRHRTRRRIPTPPCS